MGKIAKPMPPPGSYQVAMGGITTLAKRGGCFPLYVYRRDEMGDPSTRDLLRHSTDVIPPWVSPLISRRKRDQGLTPDPVSWFTEFIERHSPCIGSLNSSPAFGLRLSLMLRAASDSRAKLWRVVFRGVFVSCEAS